MLVNKRNTVKEQYRKPLENVRRKRPESRRQQDSAAVTGFTAPALEFPALAGLPTIPDSIPTSYAVPLGLLGAAQIAVNCLDAGALTDTTSGDPAVMVEKSLTQWFDGLTQRLRIFEPSLIMTKEVKQLDSGLDPDCREHFAHVTKDADTVAFGICYGDYSGFTLQEKIEALEAKVPGLGETAVLRLNKLLNHSGLAVTPNFLLYAAGSAYWMGEDDETDIMQEWCADDPEAMEGADIFRRADFDACFPKLSYEPEARLDKEVLTALMTHEDAEVAALATFLVTLELEDYIEPAYPTCHGEDHVAVTSPSVCVCWNENDLTVQIMDDFMNFEQEHGGTDLNNFWVFDNTPAGINLAFESIAKFIGRLEVAETLLGLVATPLK